MNNEQEDWNDEYFDKMRQRPINKCKAIMAEMFPNYQLRETASNNVVLFVNNSTFLFHRADDLLKWLQERA